MVVVPVFLAMMRKTTLLLMLTGELVGLNNVLVTVNAGCVIVTEAFPLLVVAPELAPAKLVALDAVVAAKNTVMFVLCPEVRVPRLVHCNVVALVTSGATLAD